VTSTGVHRLARHWLLVVLLTAGLGLRLDSSDGLGLAPLTSLVAAIAVYFVLARWSCWRWLAAVAAAPPLLETRLIIDQPTAQVAALLLVSAAVVTLGWGSWSRPLPCVVAGFVAVVAALVIVVADDTQAGHPGVPSLHLPAALLILFALVGAAAAIGLGRSSSASLRIVCWLLTGLPMTTALSSRSLDALPVLAWWPAAGALGVTALLRGRRGRATLRPQIDAVDEAAIACFRERYGVPALGPVVVVIAAYNEADGIAAVVAALPDEVCGLATDVIVVDDGSSDGTPAAVAGARAHVVACPLNRGQGAALRLGYRLARDHGAAYVLTTDADGQYGVADLPVALTPILEDRADFVTGSRILGAQHTHDRVRRVGVHAFALLATVLTGQRLTDTSFGLRAMRAEVTAAVTLNQPQYQASELLLGVLSHGFRVLEVPGSMHVRSAGSTKKGRNLVYGRRYAGVMTGTWWREGCPRPVTETAPALRQARGHDG
jgi:hypothetical protein